MVVFAAAAAATPVSFLQSDSDDCRRRTALLFESLLPPPLYDFSRRFRLSLKSSLSVSDPLATYRLVVAVD